MNFIVKPLTLLSDVNRAAEMTTHGQVCKAPLRLWYRTEHSPIRLRKFWIELQEIPTFVSVHLVRHKIGVEHFVQSMRDDRGGSSSQEVTRLTPVNHGMEINAQTLIQIAKKRLCYKSHKTTVAVFRKMTKAIAEVDSELVKWMVPECASKGYCPEFSECKPGLKAVLHAYRDSGPIQERNKAIQKCLTQ